MKIESTSGVTYSYSAGSVRCSAEVHFRNDSLQPVEDVTLLAIVDDEIHCVDVGELEPGAAGRAAVQLPGDAKQRTRLRYAVEYTDGNRKRWSVDEYDHRRRVDPTENLARPRFFDGDDAHPPHQIWIA